MEAVLDFDAHQQAQGVSVLTVEQIRTWDVSVRTENGLWVPARPTGFIGLKYRLWCCWLVLTGKGDVLLWGKL